MQTIIDIQIFTSFGRLLRKAIFLLATQGICYHTGRMNASVQLTSSIRKKNNNNNNKTAKVAVHRSKQPSFGYVFFFFKVGNLG